MDVHKFNEVVYDKIATAMESRKTEDAIEGDPYYKSFYSPATLMNNWYENRAAHIPTKETEFPISEHMDSYRKPCVSRMPDRSEYYNKIFESYGSGQELFLDHLGFSFYDNYVSTYDLCYNHLTKGICGPLPRHYHKGHYRPANDLTLIYGNLTNWGLKERLISKSKEVGLCREEYNVSEAKDEYVAYDLKEVKKLNDFSNFKRVKAIY